MLYRSLPPGHLSASVLGESVFTSRRRRILSLRLLLANMLEMWTRRQNIRVFVGDSNPTRKRKTTSLVTLFIHYLHKSYHGICCFLVNTRTKLFIDYFLNSSYALNRWLNKEMFRCFSVDRCPCVSLCNSSLLLSLFLATLNSDERHNFSLSAAAQTVSCTTIISAWRELQDTNWLN